MSLGNCKLKQQGDTITLLLRWSKLKTLTTPNVDKDVEQKEHSFITSGMQNGTGTLEDSLAVSYKTKHTLTVQSSNQSPWHLLKLIENLCPHRNLHMDVYSIFTYNCQSFEATNLFSKLIDK